VDWPPPAGELYLDDPGPRAIFQGDVYGDVPFAKIGAGDSVASDPKATYKRKHVATLLHPCYIVDGDNVTVIKSQPIALVYDAGPAGLAMPEDWQGVLGVCPLPDLMGDGSMWVVDFRKITSVDRSYLRADQRVRCLSELGWAHFRQRMIGAGTRGLNDLEDLLEVGAAAWVESELETDWVRAGRTRREFHDWLDSSAEEHGYESWRDALDDRQFELVRNASDAERAASGPRRASTVG
jgi:hypothetical protein